MTAPPPVPTPGSDAALLLGCICARMDNARGKGVPTFGGGMMWWVTDGCPVHAPAKEGTP